MLGRATQDRWFIVKSSDRNVVHWRREWQTTPVFLAREPYEQYGKAKGYDTGRGTRDKIANIYWTIEKAREFQRSIYFCFTVYAKVFDCVDHDKLEIS